MYSAGITATSPDDSQLSREMSLWKGYEFHYDGCECIFIGKYGPFCHRGQETVPLFFVKSCPVVEAILLKAPVTVRKLCPSGFTIIGHSWRDGYQSGCPQLRNVRSQECRCMTNASTIPMGTASE